MRSLHVALVVLSAVLAGCSRDPSTMVRVPTSGPRSEVVDGRTGVLAVLELRSDGTYETTLRRLEGARYVTLTPPIPDDGAGRITVVRWFDGDALAGDADGRLFRLAGGVWQTLSLSSCDPSLPEARLEDARGLDDAWIVARDPVTRTATLCRFTGTTLVAEPLPFEPDALLETEGRLVAVTSDRALRSRDREGGAWTEVGGLFELDAQLAQAVPREDAVYLHFARPYDDLGRWYRVTPAGATRVRDGIPGMDGELWRVESEVQEREECSYNLWAGRDICTTRAVLAEHRVLRVDGETPSEAGFLRLEQSELTDVVPLVLGPGQLALAGSSGQLWVTLPD